MRPFSITESASAQCVGMGGLWGGVAILPGRWVLQAEAIPPAGRESEDWVLGSLLIDRSPEHSLLLASWSSEAYSGGLQGPL